MFCWTDTTNNNLTVEIKPEKTVVQSLQIELEENTDKKEQLESRIKTIVGENIKYNNELSLYDALYQETINLRNKLEELKKAKELAENEIKELNEVKVSKSEQITKYLSSLEMKETTDLMPIYIRLYGDVIVKFSNIIQVIANNCSGDDACFDFYMSFYTHTEEKKSKHSTRSTKLSVTFPNRTLANSSKYIFYFFNDADLKKYFPGYLPSMRFVDGKLKYPCFVI